MTNDQLMLTAKNAQGSPQAARPKDAARRKRLALGMHLKSGGNRSLAAR